MKYQTNLDDIKLLKNKIKELEEELVDCFKKDTELSLEERWALFLEIEESLPMSSYISRLETIHRDTVGYNCLVHVDRHQDVYYSQIVEEIEEEFYYLLEQKELSNSKVIEKFLEDGCDLLGIETEEEFERRIEDCFNTQLNKLKQECLSTGYRGFNYDW